MATYNNSLKFTKAMITRDENGDFIIEETKKDDIVVTNLSNKLANEFLDIEGLTITIARNVETESEE